MSALRPKLMVATEFSPNASGGGPAVVRQMLREWPAERLYWWSCLPEIDTRFGQQVAEHRCAPIPQRLMPHKRFSHLKSAALEAVWAPYARANLARSIKELQPDVLWVIPHNWAILPLHGVLRSCSIPFHVSIHDYVDLPGNAVRLGLDRSIRLAKMVDHLYSCAQTRDAISYPMIADLQERMGTSAAQALHAGVESEDLGFLQTRPAISDAEIRIAYAGTILVESEFALFVAALQEAAKRVSRPVRLHFFGAHSYATRSWFQREWMCEEGNLAEPDLLLALRGCSFGFSPMALTDENPRYNRYSLPTKFISYLAAGLPIIRMGHPGSCLMKMTKDYDVGPAIQDGTVAEISDQLVALFTEQDTWARYGSEVLRCARTEFDAAKMRRILYQCLEEGASSPH